MIDYKIWCTYHDPILIEQYNLVETPNFKLYYTKDENPNKYNLNYIQLYLNEFITQYYVYKNQIKSDYVGFCHYRRIININDNTFNKDINLYVYGKNRFGKNLEEEWQLGGLNNHIELVKKYINEKHKKFATLLNNIFETQDKIAFGELYLCKWDIFNELMYFITEYIKFLFKELLNIDNKELYEYSLDEYDKLASLLNNINWNLFKEYHIKNGTWNELENPPFYGGVRSIGFCVEMLEALFWELYDDYYKKDNINK